MGRRGLGAVLAAALLIRLALLAVAAPSLSFHTSGYDAYATSLRAGHGYAPSGGPPDSELPPLYPFVLAAIYALIGRDSVTVALVQIILDLVTVAVLYSIGRRVVDARTGLVAAALYACYPYLAFQAITVNDTTLFVLLTVVGVRIAYRVADAPGWRPAAALGLVLGLSSLTKPFAPLLLVVYAAWWWRRTGGRDAARATLIAGVALVAVVAPWTLRNTRALGELVLVSTNGGGNLHAGNNPCAVEYFSRGWDVQWITCLPAPPGDLRAPERDRWHRDQAIAYLREHPGAWVPLLATKLRVLWSPTIAPASLPPNVDLGREDAVRLYSTPPFEVARTVHALYFAPLLALAAYGLVAAWRRGLPIGPLLAGPVVITLVYVLTHPSTRYRSPADPFVFVLAAYGVTRLATRLRRSGASPLTP